MQNHAGEEQRVKPRERTTEARDEAPRQCKEQITRIVNLACVTVPPISQDLVAVLGLDGAGVLDGLPWELGEGFALDDCAAGLGAETVLLRVGGVPDPVHEEVGSEEEDEDWVTVWAAPVADGVEVVGEVDAAVAVA